MPLGPSQQYIVNYNGYQFPGYVQEESFDSVESIANHYAAYADGSLSEYTGLSNKQLPLTFKVWEPDYASVKEQIQLGATMARSARDTFRPLYIQYTDRHYDAMVQSVKTSKTAGTSVRTGSYTVEFSCKPWLIGDTQHSISGTTTVTTDSVSRTIADGGWTPTLMTMSGTDITVSGYTATGDFAGFISVAGSVTNLIVDSEAYTATISSVNANDQINNVDYQMYVGPGKTSFAITGASAFNVKYYDRWYL